MNIIQAFWWVGRAIQDKSSFRIGVSAGLGSGKSHGRMQWQLARIWENVGCKFSGELWPTYQKVHDAALPLARKVLEECGLREHRHFTIIKSPFPKLVFDCLAFKPEIHYLSAEHPERIVAVEYSIAAVDEAGIISGEARRNLISRVRDNKAKIRQILEVGAPQGINDFATDYDSDTLPGWKKLDELDAVHEAKRMRRFTLWTQHNPYLPPEYLQNLYDIYGHNPGMVQSYIYGKFCPLQEGVAVSNYLPQKHDIENIYADPFYDINLCWDFNANPLAWVAIQKQFYELNTNRVFRYAAINEANEGFGQLDDACAEFAVKFPIELFGDTPIKIYGDRTGHAASHKIRGSDFETIWTNLKGLGYKNVEICATKKVAPEGASIDALNRLFLNDLIVVAKRCRLFRKSLLATRWKEGQRKLDKPAGETHTHHVDAVKYWAYQETRYESGKTQEKRLGMHRVI